MKVVITGGAGFIGCNAASRYLKAGHQVVVVDDLSRVGADRNLEWLRPQGALTFVRADIRDAPTMVDLFSNQRDADLILHLAGQVAVTTSVAYPRADFAANALGSFNVLEGIRKAKIKAPVIYSSTNKVYGGMEEATIVERDGRYDYESLPQGVPVEQPLDFHSPYGCSKGAADQYFRDYHRIYGLNTVVFRQSCIYGYRQFGVEDQGWVAWFMIAVQLGEPLTIFGDGKQVRDILFVDDLLDAFDSVLEKKEVAAGRIYNIGGGRDNVMSLLELIEYIGKRRGEPVQYEQADWRPGDQRVYVSDISRAETELSWTPLTNVALGLDQLYDWIAENRGLFA